MPDLRTSVRFQAVKHALPLLWVHFASVWAVRAPSISLPGAWAPSAHRSLVAQCVSAIWQQPGEAVRGFARGRSKPDDGGRVEHETKGRREEGGRGRGGEGARGGWGRTGGAAGRGDEDWG